MRELEAEPRRQRRGEERRLQVLDATLRVLAREGPRGVTHRAVAREAGTSVRATTYYFDSRDDLLEQALVHYADTAIARFDAFALPAESLGDGDAALLAAATLLAHVVMSDLLADRDGLVAEYELVLEISRRASLEAAYGRWQARLEQLLTGYCQAFGSDEPAIDARIVLAALRGLEIEALARPSTPPDVQDLVAAFHRLLRRLLGSGSRPAV